MVPEIGKQDFVKWLILFLAAVFDLDKGTKVLLTIEPSNGLTVLLNYAKLYEVIDRIPYL